MDYLLIFLNHVWTIWQEVAIWLLMGLIIAGSIQAFFPTGVLNRWLGGTGIGPVLKAAIIGTPLPLCSCSVLPTAIQLHRAGASTGATTSFLVATPENGADSIALSYVLLGPIMTVLRPVAAIVSAVATGLLAEFVSGSPRASDSPLSDLSTSSSCCCDGDCGDTAQDATTEKSDGQRGRAAVVGRAAIDLLDDIAGWLFLGIVLAAALETLVPPNAMAGFGSGLLAMLVISIISIPMYICATASTPVAASMLIAGISPGTVLVFLLAGPATNLASVGILRRELGGRVTAAYLAGVVGSAIAMGLLVDAMLRGMDIQVATRPGSAVEVIPTSVSLMAAILLGLLAIKPLRSFAWRLCLSRWSGP